MDASVLRQDALVAASKVFQATALAKAVELGTFAPELAARLTGEPAFSAITFDLDRALRLPCQRAPREVRCKDREVMYDAGWKWSEEEL